MDGRDEPIQINEKSYMELCKKLLDRLEEGGIIDFDDDETRKIIEFKFQNNFLFPKPVISPIKPSTKHPEKPVPIPKIDPPLQINPEKTNSEKSFEQLVKPIKFPNPTLEGSETHSKGIQIYPTFCFLDKQEPDKQEPDKQKLSKDLTNFLIKIFTKSTIHSFPKFNQIELKILSCVLSKASGERVHIRLLYQKQRAVKKKMEEDQKVKIV